MNLAKLFEMQRKLDEHIMTEHPELRGQDNLSWKILALLVEIGECANKWRGFKKWSHDQEPRTLEEIRPPRLEVIDGIKKMVDGGEYSNPLLEEFVDGLHFILSIGLELKLENWNPYISKIVVCFGGDELIAQFNEVFRIVSSFNLYNENERELWYSSVFSNYLGLGEMLGFEWEEIDQAYFRKNKINHERQVQGY